MSSSFVEELEASVRRLRQRLHIVETSAQLDNAVLEKLPDVLVHLLRNAVDHGIEAPEERRAAGKPPNATITIRATPLGRTIRLDVSDDGRGIDRERVRARAVERGLLDDDAPPLSHEELRELLFLPGFSTAAEVTQISGRGVGLAAVRKLVEDELGGTLQITDTPGMGATFQLTLPTTVLLTPVLVISLGALRVALPVDRLHQVVQVDRSQIEAVGDALAVRLDGRWASVVDLGDRLGLGSSLPRSGEATLLLHGDLERPVALVVERTHSHQMVTTRPPEAFVAGLEWLMGSVVLDDGNLALLVHPARLPRAGTTSAAPALGAEPLRPPTVLVVDDSEFTRDMLVQALLSTGCEVLEGADGRQGLDRLDRHDVDLVLADLDMPVLDGFGMIEALRKRPGGEDLPVVVISSRGSQKDHERAALAGANDYLVKRQFQEGELRRIVARYTGWHGD